LTSISSISERDDERRHRLYLTLISCVPSVPLALLPRLLDPIRSAIDTTHEDHKKRELIEALFVEIKERVGDREKEYMVRWWGEQRLKWTDTASDHEETRRGRVSETLTTRL